MKQRVKYLSISIMTVFIFLIAWYLATAVYELFPQYMLPDPITVLKTLINKFSTKIPDGATLFQHTAASLQIILTGYLCGIVFGIPLGVLMAWYKKIDMMFKPIFDTVRTIPALAWIPIFIIWLGIGLVAKSAVVFTGVFIASIVNAYAGIKQTNIVLIWVAETFGASRFQILFKVAIPSALPYIFTGLRVSLGMAWMTVVAAELIASSRGLGFMIQNARTFARPDLIIAGMIAIGLVGIILSSILEVIEKFAVKGR